MSLSLQEHKQLQQLMDEHPKNRILIQKLLDAHQFSISQISHEIRNSLSLVYSTFQLIETQHPETRTFKHWASMSQDLEYMVALLEELSTYNNSGQLKRERFSSFDFFSRISLSFATSCMDSTTEYTSRISPTLLDIQGDKIKLQEVFLNLLKNAREAVLPNGKIRLEADMSDSYLKVTVWDNGCGIPPEKQDGIFDAFVSYKPEGSGLGLAIARRVVDAHGGTITVQSSPAQGTTFTVLLPAS